MTPNTERALQALEEAIPPHLRSNRHGEGFLGERYETLRAFILATLPSGIEADGDGGKGRLLTEQEVQDAFAGAWDGEGSPPHWIERMNAVQRKLLEVNGLSPTSPPNGKTAVTACPAPCAGTMAGCAPDCHAGNRCRADAVDASRGGEQG